MNHIINHTVAKDQNPFRNFGVFLNIRPYALEPRPPRSRFLKVKYQTIHRAQPGPARISTKGNPIPATAGSGAARPCVHNTRYTSGNRRESRISWDTGIRRIRAPAARPASRQGRDLDRPRRWTASCRFYQDIVDLWSRASSYGD